MKVYDIRGQEVATLVNENRSAGMHTVYFDATNLENGIYFAVLQANEVRRVLRLMLIK